jgi:hypothetical protein
MTTPERPADDDLFTALSAIDITGPDADDLLWVSFKSDDTSIGGLSIQAQSTIGRAVMQWRDMQSAALAKALLTRASGTE